MAIKELVQESTITDKFFRPRNKKVNDGVFVAKVEGPEGVGEYPIPVDNQLEPGMRVDVDPHTRSVGKGFIITFEIKPHTNS